MQQRQDERHPLDPAKDREREEDPGPGTVASLGGQEGRDHQEQEQAFRVGHRIGRRERVDDQQAGRHRCPASAEIGRPKARQQGDRRKERDVRDQDGHDASRAGDGCRQQSDEHRIERREGDVGVGPGHRSRVIAAGCDTKVVPTVPARQRAKDRPVRAGDERRVARDQVLGDHRCEQDQQPRSDEDRDQARVKPQVRGPSAQPRASARRRRRRGHGQRWTRHPGESTRAMLDALRHRWSGDGWDNRAKRRYGGRLRSRVTSSGSVRATPPPG